MSVSELSKWINDHVEIILTFIGGTILGPSLIWLLGRRKETAEVKAHEGGATESIANAAQGIASATDTVVDIYKEQLTSMRTENAELKKEMAKIKEIVESLVTEVHGLRKGFDYLCEQVEVDYPEAVKIARHKATPVKPSKHQR